MSELADATGQATREVTLATRRYRIHALTLRQWLQIERDVGRSLDEAIVMLAGVARCVYLALDPVEGEKPSFDQWTESLVGTKELFDVFNKHGGFMLGKADDTAAKGDGKAPGTS